uniref:Protein-methionine sulfoxide oxidase MICAL3 n=3 Tax=Lygus hesperus TaxID=30085 RepID=A0A0A9Y7I0_LYGHE
MHLTGRVNTVINSSVFNILGFKERLQIVEGKKSNLWLPLFQKRHLSPPPLYNPKKWLTLEVHLSVLNSKTRLVSKMKWKKMNLLTGILAFRLQTYSETEGSDSSSESDGFAEAEDGGLDPDLETLRLAKDWTRRYASSYSSDSQDESDTEMEDDEEDEVKKKAQDGSDSGSETEIQSDDYSGDESSEEENSATEISTDSEFEHDGTTHTIPDIVISETVQVKRGHLEQPKHVQIVSRQLNGKYETTKPHNNDLKLEFKRIETKPAINNIANNNSRPKPLLNPNRGDYLLNRTQSTEGIASKISLELKKKYLLGPQGLSGNVRKSGSTSTLDTKFKSLIDQISEQQKLLHPAPNPSPTMQAYLQGAEKLKMSPIQLLDKKTLPTEGFKHICSLKEKEKDEIKEEKKEEEEIRPRSPVHETSIVVPEFPRTDKKELESDSLSSDMSSSSEETAGEEEDEEGEKERNEEPQLQSPPKLEIHNSRGELMEDAPELDSLNMPDICQAETEKSPIDKLDLVPLEFKKGITVPTDIAGSVILTQVSNPAELYVKNEEKRAESPDSSDSLKNDLTAHTETEMSDWARDEDGVSESLDDLEFINPQYRPQSGPRGVAKTAQPEDFDEYTHVCGKETANPLNLDNLEFMDTGDESSEGSSSRNQHHLNRGYIQFVDEDLTPVAEIVNPLKEELTDTTTTSEPTTVKDSPADGLRNIEYELNSMPGKVPYGTVRDSIEVMKRNQKEIIEPKGNALNSPATARKLEQLSQERTKQKDLIHEMVMNKLIAQGKSPTERPDRKKRLSRNFSPNNHASPPVEPKVVETPKTSVESVENNENRDSSNRLITPRHRSYTVGSGWVSESHRKEAFSLPDIHNACEFKTPLATPNIRSGLREQARAKFKMMSDEELGLSPEDKLKRYKLKIQKHLREDTPKSSRIGDRLDSSKKSKEDRKKSIIQAVSDFFYKKSPSPPKTPSSHSPTKNLTLNFKKDKQSDAPPVPPPPQAYTPSQEDSLSEEETHSGDNTSLVKKQRVSQRIARQAQSKRLRMAQEVQRQLEELEVKQKELEAQGVAVEKALRGEDTGENRNESELLAEWLRLTRERSEARSKEKMLVIRGQEIELEHRHARLQAQLSDIMSSSPDGRKSSEEVALEGRILREMLEIVERKNSLQGQLQAETQRFQEEDKDLEAQMIAKGLQLPQKTSVTDTKI